MFADAAREADLILLAGNLTLHGEPDEAAALVEAARDLEVPVVAVLGNHDWHANRSQELLSRLREGGVRMLERESTVLDLNATKVGVAGVKGFVGGFPDSELPDFGEPSLRRVYAETTAEVDALDRGLEDISECDVRIALLHYAPTTMTLEGEPRVIWAFLGSDRLAAPIARQAGADCLASDAVRPIPLRLQDHRRLRGPRRRLDRRRDHDQDRSRDLDEIEYVEALPRLEHPLQSGLGE